MVRKLLFVFLVLVITGVAVWLTYFFKGASLAIQVNTYHKYLDNGDYDKAYHTALELSEGGYLPAHYFIGLAYENGLGAEQDNPKAVFHYKIAANAEYDWAQAVLGSHYYNGGLGLEKSCEKSVYWFERAVNNDFAHAQSLLGKMYAKGVCVEKDHQKSLTLLNAAKAQGLVIEPEYFAMIADNRLGLR